MASLLETIKEADSRLLNAAANGMVAAIQGAVAVGADIHAVDAQGRGALHLAVRDGHMDAVRYLCETLTLDIEAQDKNGNTPLLTAFDAAHGDIAEYLVKERGANVNARDMQGNGILYKSAAKGGAFRESLMRLAVATADTVDEVNHHGHTPVHLMVKNSNLTGLEVLLLAGANPHLCGGQAGQSPLEKAKTHNLQMVAHLLEPFTKLPQPPEDMSQLSYAALVQENADGKRLLDNPVLWRRMPEVVEELRKNGEKLPDKRDLSSGGMMGYPPLALAALTHNFAAAEQCLAQNGEAVDAALFWDNHREGAGMFAKAAMQTGVLQQQFSLDVSRERGREATQELYKGLPESCRKAVPNYQQLILRLAQQEQHSQRGR